MSVRPRESTTRTRLVVEGVVVVFALGLALFAAAADDAWFQLHMMRCYCVVDQGSLSRAHAGRAACAVFALVMLVIVRPRLGRWAAPQALGALAGSTLRILGAVLLALAVTDSVLRLRGKRPPPPAPRPEVHASGTFDLDGPRKMHVAINKDGIRTRTEDDVPDLSAPTILFSGESIVWGYGLPYEDTIPVLVGAHTGVQTVNLGVNGFGNDDALAWLERWLPRFEHPVAVVSFVLYNWVNRNLIPGPTRLVLGRDGALEKAPPPSWSLLESSPLFAMLHTLVPYQDGQAVDLTRAILKRTAEVTRAHGAEPLFVFTQCQSPCRDPWLAARLVEGQPLRSIRLELDPAQEIPGDGHPNAEGTAHYAAAIEHALREANVVH